MGGTLRFFEGFGEYAAPNHARVITFLWLELLAKEELGLPLDLP